jgi:hypothetical protein
LEYLRKNLNFFKKSICFRIQEDDILIDQEETDNVTVITLKNMPFLDSEREALEKELGPLFEALVPVDKSRMQVVLLSYYRPAGQIGKIIRRVHVAVDHFRLDDGRLLRDPSAGPAQV